MAYTPYSKENAEESNAAHMIARTTIYPELFGVRPEQLEFDEDTLLADSARGRVLDGEMAVDRVVRVVVHGLHKPLVFTIQERFRKPKYSKFRDITITEWNHNTGLPSELYKLEANLFVYGYFDRYSGKFGEVVAVNTVALLKEIAGHGLPYKIGMNPRSNQSFLTFRFELLERKGLLTYHKKTESAATQSQSAAIPIRERGYIVLRTTDGTYGICPLCGSSMAGCRIARIKPAYGGKNWVHYDCIQQHMGNLKETAHDLDAA